MPLIDAETPPKDTNTHYVVYFASGQPSWCPDCRDAVPALEKVFGTDDAPTAYVVRVGEPAQWRSASNKYRKQPLNINSVPTVVRVENGKEVARLGDVESQREDLLRKLTA